MSNFPASERAFMEQQLADYQARLRAVDRAFATYRTAHDTGDAVIREILEALCRRDGLSLGSDADPGTPARNYELALRLGIGHVFGLAASPDARLAQATEAYQQARLLGREVMTGGMGWRGSLYGAVKATYPEGSRVPARRDSWQCHHEHPDELSALRCALAEVRRLAAGGDYAACEGGSCASGECQDESDARPG
jgi:hypothetical protein